MTDYTTNETPYGHCHCGCGQKTKLATKMRVEYGWIKGQPQRFIKGHHAKITGFQGYHSEQEAFWSHVIPGDQNQCWPWDGRLQKQGYGIIVCLNRNWLAHRLSYYIHFGEIPNGMKILHSCDNPTCVNPNHLSVGTQNDNVQDMVAKGRNRPQQGEQQGRTKLTEDDVRIIRHLRRRGALLREIAACFRVDLTTISRIIRQTSWTHVDS